MSEDLNKLREITGYALERGLTVGEKEGRWTEFYRVFTPYLAHDLIARLQAAEERAEKLEGALNKIADQYVPDQSADVDLAECHRIARAALKTEGA
ncbi:MAG: hypothetical protein LCH78_17935 [Proteobacteria bacterium]|nr:hypothetical protein [Pseudomonadota bacterium]